MPGALRGHRFHVRQIAEPLQGVPSHPLGRSATKSPGPNPMGIFAGNLPYMAYMVMTNIHIAIENDHI